MKSIRIYIVLLIILSLFLFVGCTNNEISDNIDSNDGAFLDQERNDGSFPNDNDSTATIEPDGNISKFIVCFVQGDGYPDIIIEVEEGVALDNIPEPKPIVGYKTKWEKFDTNNITSDLIINVIKTPIVYTITYYSHYQ